MFYPALAHAHIGAAGTSGFAHGFAHPISGLDHILAMVLVGILAFQMGGRALWLVPSAFVGMMVVGGTLGITGVNVPFVEVGIALSVIVIGFAIALELRPPVVAASLLVGLFAVFHGHAHGAEMPENAAGLAYGAGFVAATALLHVAGIVLGFATARISLRVGPGLVRLAGGIAALAGIGILSGSV